MKNEKLEFILDKYPETRSDDRMLAIAYLQEYFCETQEEKNAICKVLLKAPNIETLNRQRRFYQNELGMYLPGVGTINKRKKAQEQIKQKIREAKKDKIGFFTAISRWF